MVIDRKWLLLIKRPLAMAMMEFREMSQTDHGYWPKMITINQTIPSNGKNGVFKIWWIITRMTIIHRKWLLLIKRSLAMAMMEFRKISQTVHVYWPKMININQTITSNGNDEVFKIRWIIRKFTIIDRKWLKLIKRPLAMVMIE